MVLDTNRIEPREARRWGTREAIDGLKDPQILEGSAALVDASALNDGGFTSSTSIRDRDRPVGRLHSRAFL